MRTFVFSDADRAIIRRDMFYHPEPRVLLRMHVLWLKANQVNHHQIASLYGISRSTVHRILTRYINGGLDSVRQFHEPGARNWLLEHRESLEQAFQKYPPRSVAEAAQRIEQLTGVRRSLTQVREFLRNHLQLRWRKTSALPLPPSKTIEEHAKTQAEFLEEQLQPRLNEATQGLRTLLFVDAAHFVMGAFLGWIWCLDRLFVRSSTGRRRYNVLGAINAATFQWHSVCNTGYINSQTVCDLISQIASQYAGSPITLVLDNAKYQRCRLVQDLAKHLNIELLFLPSYSPNLNLIERVWKFTKKKVLNSRHHDSFDGFQRAIDDCLRGLSREHRQEISTLLNHRFQRFDDVRMLAG